MPEMASTRQVSGVRLHFAVCGDWGELMQADLSAAIRSWTFETALPFWLARGVDHAHGGFHETLSFDGAPVDAGFKRVRVACRQVYVFSHAAVLGWPQGLEAAEAGAQHLVKDAWRSDGAGFVRRLTSDNRVLDPTIDLYDNAFALFAFSWLYKATKAPFARDWMDRTLAAIKTTLAHPSAMGYWHDETRAGQRLQNPHMHLTEAALAAFEASRDPAFLSEATSIVALFASRFFDGETLGEYFEDDWTRANTATGLMVEPGHMMEWAWIIAAYARIIGADLSEAIAALIDFAESRGVAPDGRTYNAIRADGVVLDGGSRTWPNTERLKAAVAAHEALGRDASAQAREATHVLLSRYLTRNGGWVDALDAEGKPAAGVMPSSTLYHVFLAFAEALRCEGLYAPRAAAG